MPNVKFTQDVIEGLRAPSSEGRVYYWDTAHPGFGIRVSGKGKRVWVAQYRVDGKSIMETIAPLSDLPSLKDARQRAEKSRLAARDGVNPVAARRSARVAASVEKQATEHKAITLEQMADRYLREYCARNLHRSTLRETQRMFDHDIFPHWGKRALTSITRRDVKQLLEHKASNRERPLRGDMTGGSPVQANRNLAKLKTFFGWCVREELIPINPVIGVDRLVKEIARDRVLEDHEIAAFWHALDSQYFPYPQILRMLLLTGQRRSEVAGITWNEIDLNKKQWVIPRARAKNGKQHIVHLSSTALQIIESLPNRAQAHGTDLLFPSARVGRVVNGFAIMKPGLDKMIGNLLGKPIEHYVFHDLRRTAASGMAQLGIAPHVVDRILNHTTGTIRGVAAIYNRFQYLEERKAALDAWGAYVEGLVTAKVRRVVL